MKLSTLTYIVDEAKQYYESNRFTKYHNWNHACEVMNAAAALCDLLKITYTDACIVMIAAAWHDAVYIPRTPIGHNEIASAILLNSHFKNDTKLTPNDFVLVGFAEKLIEKTTIEHHMASDENLVDANFSPTLLVLLKILLDADLSSLGSGFWEFEKNQGNIIIENFGSMHQKGWWIPTFDFLTKLKCNDGKTSFYRTEEARRMWHAQSESNLARWRTQNEPMDLLRAQQNNTV